MALPNVNSPEGIANMRRARETLRPGDIVWYPGVMQSLLLIVEIRRHDFKTRGLYPWHGETEYVFHGNWELVGHEPKLLEAEPE